MLSKVNHSQNTYFDFIIQELIHKTRVSSRAEEALMAPKRRKTQHLSEDPHGMFAGMVVFLVEKGCKLADCRFYMSLSFSATLYFNEFKTRNLGVGFVVEDLETEVGPNGC